MRHEGLDEVYDLLQSEESLSVYCGASVTNECFHLGVCIVGLGTCHLYGASLVTQYPQYTILGELYALRFAIDCTRDFVVTNDMGHVNAVCVFGDVDHIKQLLRTNSIRAHESIRKSVRRLRRTLKMFNKYNLELTITIRSQTEKFVLSSCAPGRTSKGWRQMISCRASVSEGLLH